MSNKQLTVLVVMNDLPFPADSGGKIDFFYKLNALVDAGHTVMLVASYSDKSIVENCRVELEKLNIRVFLYPRKKTIFSILSYVPYYVRSSRLSKSELKLISDFFSDISVDVMIIDHLNSLLVSQQLNEMISPKRTVYRAHNIEFKFIKKQFFSSKVSLIKRAILGFDIIKMFFYEPISLKRFKHIAAISQREMVFFKSVNEQCDVFWLPPFFNVDVKLDYDQLDHEEKAIFKKIKSSLAGKKIILFVNNFSNGFNVDAVSWFINHVWPAMKCDDPNLHFIIAGKEAGNYITQLEGVTVVNGFDSVAPYMLLAELVVILTFGKDGVKLKLLEAIAYNKKVVSTREGVLGSGLESIIPASSNSADFVSLCSSVMKNTTNRPINNAIKILSSNEMKVSILLGRE